MLMLIEFDFLPRKMDDVRMHHTKRNLFPDRSHQCFYFISIWCWQRPSNKFILSWDWECDVATCHIWIASSSLIFIRYAGPITMVIVIVILWNDLHPNNLRRIAACLHVHALVNGITIHFTRSTETDSQFNFEFDFKNDFTRRPVNNVVGQRTCSTHDHSSLKEEFRDNFRESNDYWVSIDTALLDRKSPGTQKGMQSRHLRQFRSNRHIHPDGSEKSNVDALESCVFSSETPLYI